MIYCVVSSLLPFDCHSPKSEEYILHHFYIKDAFPKFSKHYQSAMGDLQRVQQVLEGKTPQQFITSLMRDSNNSEGREAARVFEEVIKQVQDAASRGHVSYTAKVKEVKDNAFECKRILDRVTQLLQDRAGFRYVEAEAKSTMQRLPEDEIKSDPMAGTVFSDAMEGYFLGTDYIFTLRWGARDQCGAVSEISTVTGGCPVCYTKLSGKPQFAIVPCGHCLCQACSRAVGSECPTCRGPKNSVMRVYPN